MAKQYSSAYNLDTIIMTLKRSVKIGVKTKLKEAKSQAKTYAKELINEFGDKVKLQTFVVISIGFDRLLYKKLSIK